MNRLYRLAVLTILLSLIAPHAQAAGPVKLLILGDSISTGYGLPGYPKDEKSYGKLLANALGLKGADYQNLAADGADSANVLGQASGNPSSVDAADVIMISVGGNDLLAVFMRAMKSALGLPDKASTGVLLSALASSPDTMTLINARLKDPQVQSQFTHAALDFSSNLSSLVAAVRLKNPAARLFIQTIYNPFSGIPGYEALAENAEAVLRQMNDAVAAGASGGSYSVIDTHAAFLGRAGDLTNIGQLDIHPNEAGHAVIFGLAYQAVQSAFGRAETPTSAASSAPAQVSGLHAAALIAVICLGAAALLLWRRSRSG